MATAEQIARKDRALQASIWNLLPPESTTKRGKYFVGQKGTNKWSAHCPFHEDERPSLAVFRFDDGKQRFRCYACGEKGTGIDLVMKLKGLGFPQAIEEITGEKGEYTPRAPLGKEVAHYDYFDATGTLQYRVVRYEPKEFRPFVQNAEGVFEMGFKGKERILYHTDQIAKLTPGSTVFVVEGEKDADALIAKKEHATTWTGGAESWRDNYALDLKGHNVVVIPDNDYPGYRAACAVMAACRGIAAKVGYCLVPEDKGKDVSDFLGTGGNVLDLPIVWDKLLEVPAEMAAAAKAQRDADNSNKETQQGTDTATDEESTEVPL